MSLCAVRLGDREFDEEKREKCEDRGLEESDEKLEHHERHRSEVWRKECSDNNKHFSGQDVAEKTERERDEAGKLSDELDDADGKTDRAVLYVNELTQIFECAKRREADHLNRDERDGCERERDIEVRIYTAK